MTTKAEKQQNPVALITGSAQRIGATIARKLHAVGYNTIIHYRNSTTQAEALTAELNAMRENSAVCIATNLDDIDSIRGLAENALAAWGHIDTLINSASSFYPTPLGSTTEAQWNDLINSNMKAPFFLAQALAPTLAKQQGTIVNIADIYAEKPLTKHTVYCMAKAGNIMLTQSLARELAPHVRVNGIAPGAILWPEHGGATELAAQEKLLGKIPLARTGLPEDIANTVLFLLRDAPYITGQIITVDGGRSIHF
ncbi:MAG TPA: pteridine reductase [Pseudomonadales bacterium]|nr:pteridine reductase [Pseudomonadales bacterium]